jgi:hypothetical protein
MKCTYCSKEIKKIEKQVTLKTTQGNKILEDRHFHFNCWLDDYNNSLDRKVKNYAERMMNFAKPAVEQALKSRGMI